VAYVLVGVGAAAEPVVVAWQAALARDAPGARVRSLSARSLPIAREWLAVVLANALVGVRVRAAGPAGVCLALRAEAITAGLEDDELYAAPAGDGPIEVACAHCGGAALAWAVIGDAVDCPGCGRGLVVVHHVSRRSGRFLGLLADAGLDAGLDADSGEP
jgi:hypothetical protein